MSADQELAELKARLRDRAQLWEQSITLSRLSRMGRVDLYLDGREEAVLDCAEELRDLLESP